MTIKAMIGAAAALSLGACGYFDFHRTDTGPVPPPTAEETAVEPEGWQPPEMPSAEAAAKAIADAQAAAEAGVVYAGIAQKGGIITLKTGETLRIELESVPTAGYVWTVLAAPAFMAPAGESTRGTDPAHQNLPGFTGGNHFLGFDYVATAPGTGTFKLAEGRPWETDEPPEDTYELTVTVTE